MISGDPKNVDIAKMRATLAGFEKLAKEQADLPVDKRLKLVSDAGEEVQDVVALSITMCKLIIAEAEAAQRKP
jgi:hypothetical protein